MKEQEPIQQSVADIQSMDDDTTIGTLPNGDLVVTATDSVVLVDER